MATESKVEQFPADDDPMNLCGEAVLLTAKQVAVKLGIGVRTLKRRIASGEFPELRPIRDGARILRIRCDDLGKLIERLTGENNACLFK